MNPHKITPGYDTLLIDSVHVVVKVPGLAVVVGATVIHTHASMNTRIMLVKYQVSEK